VKTGRKTTAIASRVPCPVGSNTHQLVILQNRSGAAADQALGMDGTDATDDPSLVAMRKPVGLAPQSGGPPPTVGRALG
jgi:hypothetical protein